MSHLKVKIMFNSIPASNNFCRLCKVAFAKSSYLDQAWHEGKNFFGKAYFEKELADDEK